MIIRPLPGGKQRGQVISMWDGSGPRGRWRNLGIGCGAIVASVSIVIDRAAPGKSRGETRSMRATLVYTG